MTEIVSFNRPPVIETVLGVQFERLPGLTNAHLGAFWASIKEDWPRITDAPRLDDQFEEFGKRIHWAHGIKLQVSQQILARVQIKNEAEDRMIQIQNCRLDYNWLGHRKRKEYPRYSKIKPEFEQALKQFRNFITETGMGELVPNQWEITYVNHVPKGTVWETPEEWGKVFRSLPGLAVVPGGTQLEGLGGYWHFEIIPQRGRLHVELKHGYLSSSEHEEVLIMKLTARGPIDSSDDPDAGIDKGLNLGHETIVTSFRDLTSPESHEYWNREP